MLGLSLLWFLIKGLKLPIAGVGYQNTLQSLLITAVLAALVHLMVSNLLNSPASQVAGALIMGWLFGLTTQSQATKITGNSSVLLGAAALCSLMLFPFAYHETVRMPSYRQQLPAIEEALPRFWQLGKACSGKISD
jgi:hypothetical protein